MKKLNTTGFTAVEGLLILVIVGIIGGVGYYVYDSNNKTEGILTNTVESADQNSANQQAQSSEEYQRTTTVPSDWKEYSNEEFKISMSYPANWTVRAEKSEGELVGMVYPDKSVNPQGNPQYRFDTRSQTLDEAIANRKKIVNDNQSTDEGVKLTITSEKSYTIDGHEAVRIDMTSNDGTAPDSYATEFYIFANDKVYVFDTGFHEKSAIEDQDVLTIFESIKIQ